MFQFDFRVRPPWDPTTKLNFSDDFIEMYALLNDGPSAPSVLQRDMELFWQELDEAGTDMFLYCGRRFTPDMVRGFSNGAYSGQEFNTLSNNLAVKDFITKYPDKAVGGWAVDPIDGTKALDEIEENVLKGPFQCITLEPGQGSAYKPMPIDDARVCLIYEYCEAHNIPVALTFGELNCRALRFFRPEALDNICELFPKLKLIAIHGGWPFTMELQYIAFNHENFYAALTSLVNYTWSGCEELFRGANWALQDKFIFGSAYPYWDMRAAVKRYKEGLRPEVLPKIMGVNALRALNLEHLIPQDAPKPLPNFFNIHPKFEEKNRLYENHLMP